MIPGQGQLDPSGRVRTSATGEPFATPDSGDCCPCDSRPPTPCFVNLLRCCPDVGQPNTTTLWVDCSLTPPEPGLTVFQIGSDCYYLSNDTAQEVPPGGTLVPPTSIGQWFEDCRPCCPAPINCDAIVAGTFGSTVFCTVDQGSLFFDFCDAGPNEICGRLRWPALAFPLDFSTGFGCNCFSPTPTGCPSQQTSRNIYHGVSSLQPAAANCCPSQHPPGSVSAVVRICCCSGGGFVAWLAGSHVTPFGSLAWSRCYFNAAPSVFGTYLPLGPASEPGTWLSDRPVGAGCVVCPVGNACACAPAPIYPNFLIIS